MNEILINITMICSSIAMLGLTGFLIVVAIKEWKRE